MDVKTFQALGLHQAWGDMHDMDYPVNGRANTEISESLATVGDEHYHPCPEAYLAGERRGTMHVFTIGIRAQFFREHDVGWRFICPRRTCTGR